MKPGDRVKIKAPVRRPRPLTGLEAAFEGHYGTVRDKEMGMYRVRLDEPVTIEGVGRVTSDLWSSEYLRRTTR